MPRYRDMTTAELIKWSKNWVANSDSSTAKLLFAVTMRLEQVDRDHRYGRAPEQPPASAIQPRERADTIADIIKLGRLSREARDYLASHGRPTRPPIELDQYSEEASRQLSSMAAQQAPIPCYITPAGDVVPAIPQHNGSQVHPLGNIFR